MFFLLESMYDAIPLKCNRRLQKTGNPFEGFVLCFSEPTDHN